MSDWNVIRENFHTKHSVLTAPDQHMPYIIQLHIMSIRWAYYEQMKQQNIWSFHMTSIGKENRSSQCVSYEEQYGRREGGGVARQSEGLGGVVGVYKIGLKWPVIAMAITRKPLSLSLSEGDRTQIQTWIWKLHFTRTVVQVQSKPHLTTSPCEATAEYIYDEVMLNVLGCQMTY